MKDLIDMINNGSVMETYFNILSNTHEPKIITEETVNRILLQHSTTGFIIVSANRSDETKATNDKNAKKLISMLKKSGYSYLPVYGGYHDKDNNVKDSYELSFFVTNYKKDELQEDFKPLHDLAIEICGKFNQDSVLIKDPADKPKYYDRNDNVVGSEKDNGITSINRLDKEFFTALYKKPGAGRFTYDMEFEVYANPEPCTLNERRRRLANGEIILND